LNTRNKKTDQEQSDTEKKLIRNKLSHTQSQIINNNKANAKVSQNLRDVINQNSESNYSHKDDLNTLNSIDEERLTSLESPSYNGLNNWSELLIN
jgi:5-bromo-4-chloroindolyl phosphate hydrolysis protein